MPAEPLVTRCRPLLGTFVEITVPGDMARAEPGFAAIAAVQAAMSFHDETSDLARLRAARCGTEVTLHPDTVEVLRFAAELYRESAGLFDVTIGDELSRHGFLPRPRGVRSGPLSGDASAIEILDEYTVRCHRPVLVDLGGIAKGFAVDRAVMALRAAGVTRGMVNAGGDLRVFGRGKWSVALRDADGEVRDTVEVEDQAAASSSNLHDRRWHLWRVVTPHIGAGRKPVRAQGRVTVIAPNCMLADALTKIALADADVAARIIAPRGGYILRETEHKVAA